MPQADPFGGWVVFPAYATGRLGRIRVTRGGGSGFWGPGALAGTIEMDSATPDQLSPLDLALSYGSRDSVDAQGSASLVRDGGFLTVSGAYARGDGFIPVVEGQRGPADRSAPYEQYSGAARGVVGIAPATELQMTLAAFHDARDRGTDFTDNRSDGADASVRLVGRGAWGWSALAYVQTRQFASRYASVNEARTAATLTLDQYNVPATGLGGRVEVSPPLGDTVKLRLGGDIRDTSGRTQERYTYVAGLPTRRREAGGATGMFLLSCVLYGCVAGGVVVYARLRGPRAGAAMLAWRGVPPLRARHLWWLAPMAVYHAAATTLVRWLAPDYALSLFIPLDPASLALSFLAVVVLAPLAEELFFRGWLFDILRAALPGLAATLVCAGAFALAHWDGTGLYPLAVFVPGLALTLLRARTGSAQASAWAHAIYNFVGWTGLVAISALR